MEKIIYTDSTKEGTFNTETVESVDKIDDVSYLINKIVKIKNIDFDGEAFLFDVEHVKEHISEKKAIKLCEEFIRLSLVENEEKENENDEDVK